MSGKNDIEDDRITRMARELTPKKVRVPRRTVSLAQDTHDIAVRIETKHDAWLAAENKRDTYLKTLETCYIKDKKFMRNIIIILLISLLLSLGVTGIGELLKVLPFI